jgi:hypothetical protein
MAIANNTFSGPPQVLPRPTLGSKRYLSNADQGGSKRYYVRPVWDARHVLRVLPSGGYEMAMSRRGRRRVATPISLDDIELLIGG